MSWASFRPASTRSASASTTTRARTSRKRARSIRSCPARIASSPRSRRRRTSPTNASSRRAPLRNELGDQGAIAVTANVPGATVIVAGTDYGGTPIEPRSVAPGQVELAIQKDGWKTQRATAEVIAGIVTDVAVELEPDFS